jgi:adenylylsulfate kinase-like enzyme
VLRGILLWAKSPQHQNVFWLNGLAGTGKSTIAQSITETVANDGFLGASFFCSRDYIDRRELKNIFPTLAYQLACRYPRFRKRIAGLIKKDPTIAHTSLISQLEDLLAKPLSEENISCAIVIDALDECIDD